MNAPLLKEIASMNALAFFLKVWHPATPWYARELSTGDTSVCMENCDVTTVKYHTSVGKTLGCFINTNKTVSRAETPGQLPSSMMCVYVVDFACGWPRLIVCATTAMAHSITVEWMHAGTGGIRANITRNGQRESQWQFHLTGESTWWSEWDLTRVPSFHLEFFVSERRCLEG